MNTASRSPLPSLGMQALNELFNELKAPYGQGDLVRFNLAYRRLYPQLSRAEKARAEELVDVLLDNLEDPRLASTIYGVV